MESIPTIEGSMGIPRAALPFLVASLLCSAIAGEAPEIAVPSCLDRPVRLGLHEHGIFFENGRGIDKDLVDELAKRSGCRIEMQVLVRARFWTDMEHGALDMGVFGIRTPEREKFASFVPYLTLKNLAVVRSDIAAKVRTAKEFMDDPKLILGVVRAYKHGDPQDGWIASLREQGRVEESPDPEALFQKVRARRLDAIFAQPPVCAEYLRDLKMERDVVVEDWTPSAKGTEYGLILSRQRFNESDAAAWKRIIDRMKADGSLLAILRKYLPESDAQRMLDF